MKKFLTILLFSCTASQQVVVENVTTALPTYTATFKTGDENSINQYEVQQSSDTINWNSIAIISKSGAGTYTYALPLVTNYYRIKASGIMDFYTPIVKLIIDNGVSITSPTYKTTSLTWTVVSGSNVSYYLIEKTSDGQKFSTVSKVSAKGDGKYTLRISRTVKKYTYQVTAILKDGTKSSTIIFK